MLLDWERTEILLWLSRIPYRKHHERAKEGRLHGTGDWLLRKRVFKEWQTSSTSNILWLHGIRKLSTGRARLGMSANSIINLAGAGKTKLT